jgi:hypothetical protein
MRVIGLPSDDGHLEEFAMPAPATLRTSNPSQPLASCTRPR